MQGTLESAIQQALDLTIDGHPHTGEEPYPPFPSEEALALAAERHRKRKILVFSPIQKQKVTTLKPQYLQASGGDLGASLHPAVKEEVKHSKLIAKPLKSSAAATLPAAMAEEAASKEASSKEIWQVSPWLPHRHLHVTEIKMNLTMDSYATNLLLSEASQKH